MNIYHIYIYIYIYMYVYYLTALLIFEYLDTKNYIREAKI